MVTHSPPLPPSQPRTWSIAAFAADAAEERPRASMTAAPRLPTVGMNVVRFQFSSLIFALSETPSLSAKR
jgi:hypothetical protein